MLVLYVSFLLQTLNYYWDLSDLTFHCLYFHQKNMSNHLLKIICLTLTNVSLIIFSESYKKGFQKYVLKALSQLFLIVA